MFNFVKLEVLKISKDLCKLIFDCTKEFPNDEKNTLINQMRKSALSVQSNLAEGSSRFTSKDKGHFYTIAYSSLMELVGYATILNQFNYINNQQLNEIKSKASIIEKMISKLRKNTQDSPR